MDGLNIRVFMDLKTGKVLQINVKDQYNNEKKIYFREGPKDEK